MGGHFTDAKSPTKGYQKQSWSRPEELKANEERSFQKDFHSLSKWGLTYCLHR